ncbi:unnamed protein product [Paramecium sonneborni]|uniref:Uncharacterized protein n=1 Tax=Paramecium sonneborni TaxID=65129 RepID=A0A8S1NVN3_9CILI|nr:unnamed protein product [Paramecium sonneborni]
MIFNKKYDTAQEQIHKILYQENLFSQCSKEYIKLLHYQSILQINDRNYQDAEINIQNAMLQSKLINEKAYHNYLTLYYLLISFTNVNEIHWKIKKFKKHNFLSDLSPIQQAKIMNSLAIGNLFSVSSSLIDSVQLLKQAAELQPSLSSTNYYNIAAIYYLFGQSSDKNDIIIENLIQSYKSLKQQSQDVNNLEDLWISYNLIESNEFTQKDIKILLLLAQQLFLNKQTKLGLQFLNLSNKIITANSAFQIYKPEMNFIYAAYFLDQKQVENCTDICRTILQTNVHPIQDQIKLNSLRLANKSTTIITKPIVTSQTQNKKSYRGIKLKSEFQNIEAQEIELQKQFNLQKSSSYYYQFNSDFKELFNIKYIELDIKNKIAKMLQ